MQTGVVVEEEETRMWCTSKYQQVLINDAEPGETSSV